MAAFNTVVYLFAGVPGAHAASAPFVLWKPFSSVACWFANLLTRTTLDRVGDTC